MTADPYEQLQSKILNLSVGGAIIPNKTRKDLFKIRIQPTKTVVSDSSEPGPTQIFVRVCIETGGRAGLPQRAYVRVQGIKSRNGADGELRIRPGWPRTAIELSLDVLWYSMILFPGMTFLLRFGEQPTRKNGLAFLLFLILFIADRVVVGMLYRKGKESIMEILADPWAEESEEYPS